MFVKERKSGLGLIDSDELLGALQVTLSQLAVSFPAVDVVDEFKRRLECDHRTPPPEQAPSSRTKDGARDEGIPTLSTFSGF